MNGQLFGLGVLALGGIWALTRGRSDDDDNSYTPSQLPSGSASDPVGPTSGFGESAGNSNVLVGRLRQALDSGDCGASVAASNAIVDAGVTLDAELAVRFLRQCGSWVVETMADGDSSCADILSMRSTIEGAGVSLSPTAKDKVRERCEKGDANPELIAAGYELQAIMEHIRTIEASPCFEHFGATWVPPECYGLREEYESLIQRRDAIARWINSGGQVD